MNDDEYVDELAQIGLRIIALIYQNYPINTRVAVDNALGISSLKGKSPGAYQGGMKSEKAARVVPLMHKMVAENSIQGRITADTLVDATLSAQMRHSLRAKNKDGVSFFEQIRLRLIEVAEGKPVPGGCFADLANLIGFEP